jgi:hypothetical protein
MPSLFLVTPVHGRETLTRLCLEQRLRAIAELRGLGVETRQVIVGCDGNLDAARELGFDVLDRPNVLGRKVNDGFEFACAEGADVVGYIGSDDWILPAYLAELPSDGDLSVGAWETVVSPDGRRLVVRVASASGSTPWLIPRGLLEPLGFRPSEDHRMSGIDGSIRRALNGQRTHPRRRRRAEPGPRVPLRRVDIDELQRVGFKGGVEQITPFERVVPRARRRIFRDAEPFQALADVYPPDLVGRMQEWYAEKTRRLAA